MMHDETHSTHFSWARRTRVGKPWARTGTQCQAKSKVPTQCHLDGSRNLEPRIAGERVGSSVGVTWRGEQERPDQANPLGKCLLPTSRRPAPGRALRQREAKEITDCDSALEKVV